MLDIRKIKENPDAVKAGLKAKEVDCDAIVDRILELDVQVRGLKTATETKTAQKNKLAKENGKLFGQKKGAEKKGEDTSAVEAQIAANMAESVKIDESIADDKVLLKQLEEQSPKLENTYERAVMPQGNPLAMATIKKYLELRDDLWRGLGKIPMSGFGIRKEYAKYDAEVKFGLTFPEKEGNTACRCGEVIQGRMSPQECPLFGTVCVPEDPVGPCMVSSEGACAAAYKYQGV